MRYSEHLGAFLLNKQPRETVGGFRIGQWLKTLTDAQMKELIDLGESKNAQHTSDDFLQLAVLALAAEKGIRSIEVTPEIIECLNICAALEHLSREGFIALHGVISLDPDSTPPHLTVTEKGLAAGTLLGNVN